MRSQKQLQAIAHDLGHHAQSGLSWLHPHIGEETRRAGRRSVVMDLLSEPPYPEGIAQYEPLAMACRALREWFGELIRKYGYERSDIASVTIRFSFSPHVDNYSCGVTASVTSSTGREFTKTQAMFAALDAEAFGAEGA